MKIGQGNFTSTKLKVSRQKTIETSGRKQSFSDFLHEEREKNSKELLTKRLQEIDEQGKKFVQSRNLKELKKYKELIKTYMDEAVKASIRMEEQLSYDRYGRSKKMKIIKEVDKKLTELTEMILQQERNQIEFLNRIGEIKGLLINLSY